MLQWMSLYDYDHEQILYFLHLVKNLAIHSNILFARLNTEQSDLKKKKICTMTYVVNTFTHKYQKRKAEFRKLVLHVYILISNPNIKWNWPDIRKALFSLVVAQVPFSGPLRVNGHCK